jgi:hypothetical protein
MTVIEAFEKVWDHLIHEGKQQPNIRSWEIWIRPEMRSVSAIKGIRYSNTGDRNLETRYVSVNVGADGVEYSFIKGDEDALILLATVIS